MDYSFKYYTENYFEDVEALVLDSYGWDTPLFGLARLEFAHGVYSDILGCHDAWEQQVGLYFRDGKLSACAMNEGNDDGAAFFVFRDRETAFDRELLEDKVAFAESNMSCVEDKDGIRRALRIFVPEWNTALADAARDAGDLPRQCA